MNLQKDIVSVGEILFDCYPGYKLLGGAPFNFIYHIWQLSGKGKLISRVGNDDYGTEILESLNNENFDISLIQKDKKHLTGKVEVNLNEDKIPKFIIEENTAYDFISLSTKTKEYIENETGLIYFGSLAQRNKTSRYTIRKMFGKNIIYFFDVNLRQNFYSKKILLDSLEHTDILKVNEDELKIINDIFFDKTCSFIETPQMLINKFGIELICITLGEEGAILIKGGKINKHKHEVSDVVDTVGAGDAFSAMLCLGYLLNWDINKINIIASEFAAEICTINGAIPRNKKFYSKYIDLIST